MNLLKKILNREPKKTKYPTVDDIQLIASSYGKTLQGNAPAAGCVADVKMLPYSKDAIKKALLVAIKFTDDTEIRAQLKFAYIELSSWQENVGDKSIGLDLTGIDINSNPENLVELVSTQAKEFEQWKPIIEADRNALEQDLIDLKL